MDRELKLAQGILKSCYTNEWQESYICCVHCWERVTTEHVYSKPQEGQPIYSEWWQAWIDYALDKTQDIPNFPHQENCLVLVALEVLKEHAIP